MGGASHKLSPYVDVCPLVLEKHLSHAADAGRALLHSVHAPLRHDLYCSVLGAYAMWGSATAAHRLHTLVQRTTSGSAMLRELLGWLLTLARLSLLAFLTLIVIPFMVGLYLDLVMLPFRQVDWRDSQALLDVSFEKLSVFEFEG